MEVTITFRPPSRKNGHAGPALHERTLSGVPTALAEQIADDFVRRRSTPDGADMSKLYQYKKDGNDILIALDFSEIIAVTATES